MLKVLFYVCLWKLEIKKKEYFRTLYISSSKSHIKEVLKYFEFRRKEIRMYELNCYEKVQII